MISTTKSNSLSQSCIGSEQLCQTFPNHFAFCNVYDSFYLKLCYRYFLIVVFRKSKVLKSGDELFIDSFWWWRWWKRDVQRTDVKWYRVKMIEDEFNIIDTEKNVTVTVFSERRQLHTEHLLLFLITIVERLVFIGTILLSTWIYCQFQARIPQTTCPIWKYLS
jgi:hypothetical protein